MSTIPTKKNFKKSFKNNFAVYTAMLFGSTALTSCVGDGFESSGGASKSNFDNLVPAGYDSPSGSSKRSLKSGDYETKNEVNTESISPHLKISYVSPLLNSGSISQSASSLIFQRSFIQGNYYTSNVMSSYSLDANYEHGFRQTFEYTISGNRQRVDLFAPDDFSKHHFVMFYDTPDSDMPGINPANFYHDGASTPYDNLAQRDIYRYWGRMNGLVYEKAGQYAPYHLAGKYSGEGDITLSFRDWEKNIAGNFDVTNTEGSAKFPVRVRFIAKLDPATGKSNGGFSTFSFSHEEYQIVDKNTVSAAQYGQNSEEIAGVIHGTVWVNNTYHSVFFSGHLQDGDNNLDAINYAGAGNIGDGLNTAGPYNSQVPLGNNDDVTYLEIQSGKLDSSGNPIYVRALATGKYDVVDPTDTLKTLSLDYLNGQSTTARLSLTYWDTSNAGYPQNLFDGSVGKVPTSWIEKSKEKGITEAFNYFKRTDNHLSDMVVYVPPTYKYHHFIYEQDNWARFDPDIDQSKFYFDGIDTPTSKLAGRLTYAAKLTGHQFEKVLDKRTLVAKYSGVADVTVDLSAAYMDFYANFQSLTRDEGTAETPALVRFDGTVTEGGFATGSTEVQFRSTVASPEKIENSFAAQIFGPDANEIAGSAYLQLSDDSHHSMYFSGTTDGVFQKPTPTNPNTPGTGGGGTGGGGTGNPGTDPNIPTSSEVSYSYDSSGRLLDLNAGTYYVKRTDPRTVGVSYLEMEYENRIASFSFFQDGSEKFSKNNIWFTTLLSNYQHIGTTHYSSYTHPVDNSQRGIALLLPYTHSFISATSHHFFIDILNGNGLYKEELPIIYFDGITPTSNPTSGIGQYAVKLTGRKFVKDSSSNNYEIAASYETKVGTTNTLNIDFSTGGLRGAFSTQTDGSSPGSYSPTIKVDGKLQNGKLTGKTSLDSEVYFNSFVGELFGVDSQEVAAVSEFNVAGKDEAHQIIYSGIREAVDTSGPSIPVPDLGPGTGPTNPGTGPTNPGTGPTNPGTGPSQPVPGSGVYNVLQEGKYELIDVFGNTSAELTLSSTALDSDYKFSAQPSVQLYDLQWKTYDFDNQDSNARIGSYYPNASTFIFNYGNSVNNGRKDLVYHFDNAQRVDPDNSYDLQKNQEMKTWDVFFPEGYQYSYTGKIGKLKVESDGQITRRGTEFFYGGVDQTTSYQRSLLSGTALYSSSVQGSLSTDYVHVTDFHGMGNINVDFNTGSISGDFTADGTSQLSDGSYERFDINFSGNLTSNEAFMKKGTWDISHTSLNSGNGNSVSTNLVSGQLYGPNAEEIGVSGVLIQNNVNGEERFDIVANGRKSN